jgi:hypothetical protein
MYPKVSIGLIFAYSSQTVRSHWGSLMQAGTARREYPDVQLNNIITLATRVRIVIMRVGTVRYTLVRIVFIMIYT